VRNLTDFGAFVEIVPGVDGLVHISDMSWTRRINHPSEVVQKGDEVEAVITSIDSYNQRISLSMKELLPNEWEEYANTHGVGDVVTGAITNVTDFGIFVELAPGVEGLCHISEIDRDEGLALAEMYVGGQPVRCRILRIDWHESRIGLSMHGIDQDDVEADSAIEAGETTGTDTAMAAALRAGGLVEEEAEAADEVAEDAAESAASEEEPVAADPGATDEVAESTEASKVEEQQASADESEEKAADSEEAASAEIEEEADKNEETAAGADTEEAPATETVDEDDSVEAAGEPADSGSDDEEKKD
jgi:small subunit ribosomal protein S1